MDKQLRELTRNMSYRPAASDSAIASLQQLLNFELPSQYVDFTRAANGADGQVGSHYLVLLPVEEIGTHNDELNVSELAPGLVIFADNGSGEAYAFDTASKDYPIVNVPYVGMSREDARFVAPTLVEFLAALSRE